MTKFDFIWRGQSFLSGAFENYLWIHSRLYSIRLLDEGWGIQRRLGTLSAIVLVAAGTKSGSSGGCEL
jgi:hypothetical protein